MPPPPPPAQKNRSAPLPDPRTLLILAAAAAAMALAVAAALPSAAYGASDADNALKDARAELVKKRAEQRALQAEYDDLVTRLPQLDAEIQVARKDVQRERERLRETRADDIVSWDDVKRLRDQEARLAAANQKLSDLQQEKGDLIRERGDLRNALHLAAWRADRFAEELKVNATRAGQTSSIGIRISSTCLIIAEIDRAAGRSPSACPTYDDLIDLDMSLPGSGEWRTNARTGFTERGPPEYRNHHRLYHNDTTPRIIVDPDARLAAELKMIVIERSVPPLTPDNLHHTTGDGNPFPSLPYLHTRVADRHCVKATIGAQDTSDWRRLLDDTIAYLRSGCNDTKIDTVGLLLLPPPSPPFVQPEGPPALELGEQHKQTEYCHEQYKRCPAWPPWSEWLPTLHQPAPDGNIWRRRRRRRGRREWKAASSSSSSSGSGDTRSSARTATTPFGPGKTPTDSNVASAADGSGATSTPSYDRSGRSPPRSPTDGGRRLSDRDVAIADTIARLALESDAAAAAPPPHEPDVKYTVVEVAGDEPPPPPPSSGAPAPVEKISPPRSAGDDDAAAAGAAAWKKTRMSAARRAKLYPVVAAQQGGEYCVMCGQTPIELAAAGRSSQLCIDHSDNDPSHNDRRNLQLLCHSCNTIKNHPRAADPDDKPPGPELAIAKRAVPGFRSWIFNEFLPDHDKCYPLKELLDDAAEYLDVSQETVRRYLGRACSKYGMYATVYPLGGGRPYVRLRMDVATGKNLRLPDLEESGGDGRLRPPAEDGDE